MSRELENQIKRANNMLKYYNEKLKNDQSKRKDMGFNNTKKLIKIMCYLILVIINISLLKAKAPNTPSKEKEASINSKYKNPTNPEHFTVSAQSLARASCFLSSHSANPSITK